jgi:hypothetical protein
MDYSEKNRQQFPVKTGNNFLPKRHPEGIMQPLPDARRVRPAEGRSPFTILKN